MKKIVYYAVTFVVIAASIAFIAFKLNQVDAVSLFFGENEICSIENRSIADEALTLLKSKLKNGNVDVDVPKVTYKYGKSSSEKILDAEECAGAMFDSITEKLVRAYSVECKGSRITVCATYGDAESIINELILSAEDELGKYLDSDSVVVTDDFIIKSILTSKGNVNSLEKARTLLFGDTDLADIPFNSVKPFSRSGIVFGRELDRSADRNSADSGSGITYGNTGISVGYGTETVKKYTEIIDFDVISIESRKLYVGESSVTEKGEKGLAEITVKFLTHANGEIEAQIVDKKIIKEPKSQTELKGVKSYPSTAPTGSFIWPIKDSWFYISSSYNIRRQGLDHGTGHLGIDLACPEGTNILAADGGTVIFVGELSSYGNMVKIQHEDGVMTYYAHMKSIDVNEGDRVFKGQVIGHVGNTGTATGFHLHFEVRLNGNTVNPIQYLPEKKELDIRG